MTSPGDIITAYWLVGYASIIGAAFLAIGVLTVIDGIRVRLNRHRYQRPKK